MCHVKGERMFPHTKTIQAHILICYSKVEQETNRNAVGQEDHIITDAFENKRVLIFCKISPGLFLLHS